MTRAQLVCRSASLRLPLRPVLRVGRPFMLPSAPRGCYDASPASEIDHSARLGLKKRCLPTLLELTYQPNNNSVRAQPGFP